MIIDTFLSANTTKGFVSLYGDFLKGKSSISSRAVRGRAKAL